MKIINNHNCLICSNLQRFAKVLCREEGIRTLDTVSRIPAFQASPFNHSGTSLFIQGGKTKWIAPLSKE